MAEASTEEEVGAASVAQPFISDSTFALGQQLDSLFSNLNSTPEGRVQRSEECLGALKDTLFLYERELATSEDLQDRLVTLMDGAFHISVEKGCSSFHVVFDLKWKDQHRKRNRCFELLLSRAFDCNAQGDCLPIMDCLGEVLDDNNRTTTDLLLDNMESLLKDLVGNDVHRRRVASEVMAKIVATSAFIIKRSPTLLELLTSSCAVLGTLKDAMETSDAWDRMALLHLTSALIEESFYEMTVTLKNDVVNLLLHYMETEAGDSELQGVLLAFTHIGVKPAFSATWDLPRLVAFLCGRNWAQYSVLTRVAAVEGIAKAAYLLCQENDDYYKDLLTSAMDLVSSDISMEVVYVGLQMLEEVLETSRGLRLVHDVVITLRDSIDRLPHVDKIYEVLERIRERYGNEVMDPIDQLLRSYLLTSQEHLNFGKVNALLRFVQPPMACCDPLLSRLRVNVSMHRPTPVILRSLPLLPTLERTGQLDDVLSVFSHDDREVRRAAITTALELCMLMMQHNELHFEQHGDASYEQSLNHAVHHAVERVLDVAIVDRDPEIRFWALRQLTQPFFPYLSYPESLEALIMTRSDNDKATRNLSLTLLCQLLRYSPSTVGPYLKLAQDYMLRDVATKDSSVSFAIDKAELLKMCVDCDALLIPTSTLQSIVLKRLEEEPFTSRSLSISLLQLIRSTLERMGPQYTADFDTFLRPMLMIINDGDSSSRRLEALETLATLLTHITTPDIPGLIDMYRAVSRIIRRENEEDESVIIAAMKVLSSIGAVNPVKMRRVCRVLEYDKMEEEEVVVTSAVAHSKPRLRISTNMPERFPSVVLYYLVRSLQFALDRRQQTDALTAIRAMMGKVEAKVRLSLLTQLRKQLQTWLRDPERAFLYETVLELMNELAIVLRQFKEEVASSVGYDLLQSIRVFCQRPQSSQKPCSAYVVQLLGSLARVIPAQQMREHRWTVVFIHQRLSQNKDDLDLVHCVVKSLEFFTAVMQERELLIILPQVLQCIEPAKTSPDGQLTKSKEINYACFDFLSYLMPKQLSLVKHCCAQIVHTILWYIELTDDKEEVDISFNILATLVDSVKKPAERFISSIDRVAERKGLSSSYFSELVRFIAGGARTRRMTSSDTDFNPDLPITVTSHLPRLSKEDFEQELRSLLPAENVRIDILDVRQEQGQSMIDFAFGPGAAAVACCNLFCRKVCDKKSTLCRHLGILNVEQMKERARPIEAELIKGLSAMPEAKTTKHEQSWVLWLHNFTVTLLRNSPYSVLRVARTVADRNTELASDLFPFAVAAFCSQAETSVRAQLMHVFDEALISAPADVKQGLFSVAEFMEDERDEERVRLVKGTRQGVIGVDRETANEKFGINYDQDPVKGVAVTKLTPNGLGARAGVPIGAKLLAINQKPVRAISDIRGMIEGLTHIELLLEYETEEKVRSVRKPLMNLERLAEVASSSKMHIKAIYFNEVLFEKLLRQIGTVEDRRNKQVRRVMMIAEDLIQFYRHLNLTMTANGLLKTLKRKFSEEIFSPEKSGSEEIASLEQLNWWNEARKQYEARMNRYDTGHLDVASLVGVLRCEHALGHACRVQELAEEYWDQLQLEARQRVAPFLAKAALNLGEWDVFDGIGSDDHLLSVFGVVEHCATLFRANRFDKLLQYTAKERESMRESFADSLNESYSRSYDGLTCLQHLRHFDEIVLYINACEERRALLRGVWNRRLLQMSARPEDLVTVLSINSLVLSPEEDLRSYVYVIRCLCKAQWFSYAEHLLHRLVQVDATPEYLCHCDPDLIHTYMKFRYLTKNKSGAYDDLREILAAVELNAEGAVLETWGSCWLLLGEWTMSLFPERGEDAIQELKYATELAPTNAAAFHSLGILHFDLARDPSTGGEVQTEHFICCIRSLFASIQVCHDDSGNLVMQDVLRILSVWFANSGLQSINEEVNDGMNKVATHVWLNVVPQLIARIGIEARLARKILTDLLICVGSQYAQALIYPLTVAKKSPDAIRQHMAELVISGICKIPENARVVQEASLVSNEMVRIAILWTEQWHAAIQKAAYTPNSAEKILARLQPLYEKLDRVSTPSEHHFERAFGQTLRSARKALEADKNDEAWGYLRHVYSQLRRGVLERRLSMSDVSPMLDGIRNSIVAVPGTFEHDKPITTIQRFHSRVYVMPSKQKPRRIGLDAVDGRTYHFLLKGHEDMRQDERVMQFIRLIDTIFQSVNAASAIGLSIPQYAVIPLTDNVGLVGWMENTETIYKLLEIHRQAHEVSIYEEVCLIVKKGNLANIEDYHRLSKQQRKALLNYAVDNTPNTELRHIFWDHNDTCEQWLGYRQTFGQTLAAMSMVGYVLGLGDRHLNNLMLQENGTVVHIDFGDCFEVAMHRALYAEAVPFRLTRLLVCALGVTGVDGVYRMTCELAMKNLRRHRENLLSILEAFIYDPLINWRLNGGAESPEKLPLKACHPEGLGGAGNSAAACLGVEEAPDAEKKNMAMQLSRSVSKAPTHAAAATEGNQVSVNGEEMRNQQGDLALARVQAKLTGQDFGVVNSSFSLMRSSRRVDALGSQQQGSSWGSNSMHGFTDSPKDSFAAPLLTTYLSLRALNGGNEGLDVPRQVDRLIQEATSMDNLADAYITGWAPFW